MQPTKIMLVGPQGSGKGTQAKLLAERIRLPHIAPGDVFRLFARRETPLGKEVSAYTKKGKLVPDEITNSIIAERLREPDAQGGYIFDGYPRNEQQARAFDALGSFDAVVEIALDDEVAVERLAGRRMCEDGHTYHLEHNPPKQEGRCDVDGQSLFQRQDDQPDAIRERLAIYHRETEPLIARYAPKAQVIRVDGTAPIKEVAATIADALHRGA